MLLLNLFQVSVNVEPELDIFLIRDVNLLITNALGAALILGIIAFIIYFIWSAISWQSAGGDKTQLGMARQRMTNAGIGLAILASVFAIFILVVYVLGLPIGT